MGRWACRHQCLSLFFLLDMKTAVISVQALVVSRLDYCNYLLCGLPSILVKRLLRVQNAAARVIANAGERNHISPILFKLHRLPVEFRIKYSILLVQKSRLKNFGASSFATAALGLWNSLDSRISLQKIMASFRRSLKTELVCQALGDLIQ